MNWTLASKDQLIQVVLYEECDISYKFRAAAELQHRRKQERISRRLKNEAWRSMYPLIERDIENLKVKFKLLVADMESHNVTTDDARRFIFRKLLDASYFYTPREEQRIKQMYESGVDTQVIAEQLGRNRQSILDKIKFMRRQGIISHRRKKERRREENEKEMQISGMQRPGTEDVGLGPTL